MCTHAHSMLDLHPVGLPQVVLRSDLGLGVGLGLGLPAPSKSSTACAAVAARAACMVKGGDIGDLGGG